MRDVNGVTDHGVVEIIPHDPDAPAERPAMVQVTITGVAEVLQTVAVMLELEEAAALRDALAFVLAHPDGGD